MEHMHFEIYVPAWLVWIIAIWCIVSVVLTAINVYLRVRLLPATRELHNAEDRLLATLNEFVERMAERDRVSKHEDNRNRSIDIEAVSRAHDRTDLN